MYPRLYTIGYLGQGRHLYAITTEGPLCGTAKGPRFRPAADASNPIFRRCVLALVNGRGRLRRATGTERVRWGK